MKEVSVVIPNYNGIAFIRPCLDSLLQQTFQSFEILVVDNGSQDGSRETVQSEYPGVKLIPLSENTGFCHAVNVGIKEAKAPYVILLNNDTQVHPDFVMEMQKGIKERPRAFSCGAKMIQMADRSKIDDAGDYYNALGWAFARGKGKPQNRYQKPCKIFTACGGAVIYKKELLKKTGLFDEEHFAYLEDMDLGYRARILGYENWFLPDAIVYHAGSGTSGSRYNLFKVRYSSRNNVYMIYKNMPLGQIFLNLPFLMAGFAIKLIFFGVKGFGREYAAGIKNGFSLCFQGRKKGKKVKFSWKNLKNYGIIQLQLWINLFRRFIG
ncbi:MAG: glycosyltransferase family 2 protein [Ruminococcus sp.]|jgi:GT2 family glycosyltransferase